MPPSRRYHRITLKSEFPQPIYHDHPPSTEQPSPADPLEPGGGELFARNEHPMGLEDGVPLREGLFLGALAVSFTISVDDLVLPQRDKIELY